MVCARLLVPSNKRPTFGRNEGKRRRKTNLASIEFAGRWSLITNPRLRNRNRVRTGYRSTRNCGRLPWKNSRVFYCGVTAIVFRRLLERESFAVTWYELGRIYRRWEARGEIRGGYFVGGVSGEQFALPEAIGLLRSIRKASPKNATGHAERSRSTEFAGHSHPRTTNLRAHGKSCSLS